MTSMNRTPIIKVTTNEAAADVETARILLQQTLEKEEQIKRDAETELLRKRAINELTGSSIHLPTKAPTDGESPRAA